MDASRLTLRDFYAQFYRPEMLGSSTPLLTLSEWTRLLDLWDEFVGDAVTLADLRPKHADQFRAGYRQSQVDRNILPTRYALDRRLEKLAGLIKFAMCRKLLEPSVAQPFVDRCRAWRGYHEPGRRSGNWYARKFAQPAVARGCRQSS